MATLSVLTCTHTNTHTVTRQYSHADWSGIGSRLPAISGIVDTYNSNETTGLHLYQNVICHYSVSTIVQETTLCSVEPNSNQHTSGNVWLYSTRKTPMARCMNPIMGDLLKNPCYETWAQDNACKKIVFWGHCMCILALLPTAGLLEYNLKTLPELGPSLFHCLQ